MARSTFADGGCGLRRIDVSAESWWCDGRVANNFGLNNLEKFALERNFTIWEQRMNEAGGVDQSGGFQQR